jgi:hypothetical protein
VNNGIVPVGPPVILGPPLNPELKDCIDGTLFAMKNPTLPALAKCDEVQRELKMVVSTGAAPLTGLYNLKGERCPNGTVPSASNQCVFEVKAWWRAQCIPPIDNAGKCVKAKEFLVDYSVTQMGPPLPGVAPNSVVKSGIGAGFQRPTAVISMASIALAQSGSASITCADLYPNDFSKSIQTGVDATGAPICGNPLQTQICDMEKAQVNANGGATQNCNPNLVVVKLQGLSHTVNQCVLAPAMGKLVDATTGQEATLSLVGGIKINGVSINSANVNSYNGKYFCGLTALGPYNAACPTGWNNYAQWKKTNVANCDQGTWTNCNCPQNCPSAVTVGGGGYINGPQPEQKFYRWKNVRGALCVGPCACSQDSEAGNSPCRATMNRVGCI